MNSDGFTLLAAEDDLDDAFLLRRALRKSCVSRIHIVADGEELLSYLAGEGSFSDRVKFPFPDCILVDIKMPKLTGLEALRRIRKSRLTANLLTIVWSSSNEEKDLAFVRELGAEYIMKPSDPVILAASLRRAFIALKLCDTGD